MSRTRGLVAPTNWAETVWPALKVDDLGTSIASYQYVAEFVANAWAVEGDTSLDDSDDPPVRPIWNGKGSSSYGRTQKDIATDVKSGRSSLRV